ncbi:MAG TPA: SGNH/GDSL hydrolase family protein [Polyangiaceae bacterium]|nr:SGNH/GDSL hydrolase family protein [Polyangiaceae bacterium]
MSAADGGSISAGGQSSGSGGDELGGQNMGGAAAGGAPGAGGQGATAKGDLVAQGVRWVGRVSAQESTRFAWSGAGFVARFSGTGLSATLTNAEGYLFQIVIDGAARDAFLAKRGEAAYPLATGLTRGEHVVELYRQTEGRYGDSELEKISVVDGELLDPPPGPDAVLEVIGDSITCGYGNLGANASCSFSFATESHWDSYGAVAGRALGVDVHTIAISGHGLTRNNDGTTVDLLPEVYERTLTRDPSLRWRYSVSPKVVVLNLGTNDFAKGNPGVNFEDQYLNFLTRLREIHPKAFLLATLGPMMNGSNLNAARAYVQNAVSAFEAAGNAGKVGFFEYSGQVTGELGCNSHPNASKHKQMADALVAEINELSLY